MRTNPAASRKRSRRSPQTKPQLVVVRIVVEARQPGCEAFDRDFVFGVEIDEGAQLLGDPRQRYRFVAAASFEFFDAAISEIHRRYSGKAVASSISVSCSLRR